MTRNAFTTGYISAMAWLAINENGSDDGLTVDDLPANVVDELTADAHAFYDANVDLLTDTISVHSTADDSLEFAAGLGEDFALTRNRHGTGYWDRGLGEHGLALTDLAHTYGDSAVYVDADGGITLHN
jgi:hypothetical protein